MKIPVREIPPGTEAVTMRRVLDGQADGGWKIEPWDRMLAGAAPCAHIMQLYRDQNLLDRAVSPLAGVALTSGNGIVLISTLAHWNAIHTPARESLEQDIAEQPPHLVRISTPKPLWSLRDICSRSTIGKRTAMLSASGD